MSTQSPFLRTKLKPRPLQIREMKFLFLESSPLESVVAVLIIVFLVAYSTVFEADYSKKLAYLYIHPWWRFLVVFLLIAAALWSPMIGVMLSLLLFFYLSDMNTLVTPLPNL